MMTLKTQMTDDLDSVFFNTDEHAETITYNGADIKAIVDYEENPDEQAGAALAQAVIEIRASDVADPTYRDTVVIGSVTWHVRRVLGGDGFTWRVRIQSSERPVW